MEKKKFLQSIKDNCSEITFISIEHIFNKIYKNNKIVDELEVKEFLSNYKNYHIYLNDFAGVVYTKYNSSIDQIYIEMCKFLNIDIDNSYTLEYVISKLEKQTPQLILALTNIEIQKQTIINFEDKLKAIEYSQYYQDNKEKFIVRVEKLQNNIFLVKNALGYKTI